MTISSEHSFQSSWCVDSRYRLSTYWNLELTSNLLWFAMLLSKEDKRQMTSTSNQLTKSTLLVVGANLKRGWSPAYRARLIIELILSAIGGCTCNQGWFCKRRDIFRRKLRTWDDKTTNALRQCWLKRRKPLDNRVLFLIHVSIHEWNCKHVNTYRLSHSSSFLLVWCGDARRQSLAL